ncbi:MAG: hypothetical protein KF901_14865 [Myxococcales bacterium]|nr:hypothetical protein [Myxococcales bacterium]
MALTEVRRATLAKHAVVRTAPGHYAMASAGGRPRLWQYATRAALGGYQRGVASAADARGTALVERGWLGAQRGLVEAVNALVERQVPDADFLAVHLDPDGLHVLSVGDVRAYLHRGRKRPKRLTPREHGEGGILEGEPARLTFAPDPGDLVLAGSASAFSAEAIGRVAAVLASDPNTPPAVLAALLTEPAEQAGVGAVALAMRIR